jgi:CRISPR-associated protein Csc1
MRVYRGRLTLLEHTFFASRELGIYFQTEPLLGNYALTYALGLCHAPYRWDGGPRYREDLTPLNERGIYVTPTAFAAPRFVVSQFNAQTDTYYSRYDQNAIATLRLEATDGKKARPANFPQAGKIRLLATGNTASFYLFDEGEQLKPENLPRYIRLGKFMSKARVGWENMRVVPRDGSDTQIESLLNAVDLPDPRLLRVFTVANIHPAPLLSGCRMDGPLWALDDGAALPRGLRYGVEAL